MAGNIPICENWAITKVEVVDTTFMWSLKNFSSVQDVPRGISSPVFRDKKVHFNWVVILYPSGQDGSNHVDFQLYLVQGLASRIMTKFRFSVIDQKGRIAHQSEWSRFKEFSDEKRAWGVQSFIEKSKLLDSDTADLLLPHDSLTIFCEIKINVGFLNDSGRCDVIQTLNISRQELRLARDLYNLYKSRLCSDVQLLVDSNDICAHKAVLSVRSTHFAKLIQECKHNINGVCVIELNDFNYDTMLEVVHYMYTEKTKNLTLYATSLLAAAEKYCLPDLKVACENSLISSMNSVNVSSLLVIAVDFSANKLKEKAVAYIISHAVEVTKTAGYEYLKISKPDLIVEISSSMKNQKMPPNGIPERPNIKKKKLKEDSQQLFE